MKQHSLSRRLAPALLAAGLLAGCAAPGGQAASPAEPVAITVWTYYNGAQLDAFNQLVDEFNATAGAEAGILVETASQGSVSELADSVLSAAQGKVGAGEIPNVFAAYADTAYAVDQLGLAADLSAYLTEEELAAFVPSYIDEGRFDGQSVKIFPVAKSVEVFLLNKTDWDVFARATGATCDSFSTVEGLTATAQAYYEWTDSLTPEIPDDGAAFFGRDAMANYFLIGAMQLGCEIFTVEDGQVTLHFDKAVVRRLWDNYYIPYVKGYFASSGRFRSDDVKTGNVIAFVGSSSGATFFPDQVNLSDTESHPIEMEAFACPQFDGGAAFAVQQGAGMVVTAGEEREVSASVAFLKWFTQAERNIRFSLASGYLPVTREANDLERIRATGEALSPTLEKVLQASVDTVNANTLYTPRAFSNGSAARDVLERAMQEQAAADRTAVEERLAQGQPLAEAAAEFTSDRHFDAWYQETLQALTALTA